MKTVVVVGVGALGSQLVPLLRNIETSVTVVDFDRVEARNTQSQFHSKPSIGKLKVQGLQQTMQFLFGWKIGANPVKLVADNVVQLLGGADLVIDCLDNAPSRRIVQTFVRGAKIACLHGAVDADGAFGRVVWDLDAQGRPLFVIDEGGPVGAPTCENGEHLPFLSIVASYLAHSVKEYLRKGAQLSYQVSPGGVFLV
jgi:molybdopterin-synthase adenylyltransferase